MNSKTTLLIICFSFIMISASFLTDGSANAQKNHVLSKSKQKQQRLSESLSYRIRYLKEHSENTNEEIKMLKLFVPSPLLISPARRLTDQSIGYPPIGIEIIDNNFNFLPIKNMIYHIDNGAIILRTILESYNPNATPENKEELLTNAVGTNNISRQDQLFLLHLAHAIYLENKHLVPWSLNNYSREQILALFSWNGNEVIEYFQSPDNYSGPYTGAATKGKFRVYTRSGNMNGMTDYENLFTFTSTLIQNTSNPEIATGQIINWITRSFQHPYTFDQNNPHRLTVYSPVEGPGGYGDIASQYLFRERLAGCHIASKILTGMLRSVNIPAYALIFDGHGNTFVPTINKYIHGDHLAGSFKPALPARYLLLSKQTLMDFVKDSDQYAEMTELIMYIENLKWDSNYVYSQETYHYFLLSGLYFTDNTSNQIHLTLWNQLLIYLQEEPDWPQRWNELRDLLPEYQLNAEPPQHNYSLPASYDLQDIPIRTLRELSNWN